MDRNAKPVIAMMYDFDKTLCTKDMQEYGFIPNLGLKPEQFWSEAGSLAKDHKMDRVLSYMYLMIRKSHDHHSSIRRDTFVSLGSSIEFYPGVIDKRIWQKDRGRRRTLHNILRAQRDHRGLPDIQGVQRGVRLRILLR